LRETRHTQTIELVIHPAARAEVHPEIQIRQDDTITTNTHPTTGTPASSASVATPLKTAPTSMAKSVRFRIIYDDIRFAQPFGLTTFWYSNR